MLSNCVGKWICAQGEGLGVALKLGYLLEPLSSWIIFVLESTKFLCSVLRAHENPKDAAASTNSAVDVASTPNM